MKRVRGRMAITMTLMLVIVGLVGLKMLSRGWFGLEKAKHKAEVATPMVWPPKLAPESDTFCYSVKLTLPQLDKANEEGWAVDQNRRCITHESKKARDENEAKRAQYQADQAVQQQKRALEQKLQEELNTAVAQQVGQGSITLKSLAQAREGVVTQVQLALLPGAERKPRAVLNPPADLFVPVTYASGAMQLQGFVTPNPKDGKRHPLIIWLTGGDTNSLDNFWTEGSPDNDQSASAFRKAGMVMMFPTLRGGNTNPGKREYFWGEVDDVIAAVLYAAKLPYVDPTRIYLGGHSTGATLALLVAATGLPVQGVFAFGPVADVTQYPPNGMPVAWKQLSEQERQLRAPKQWLHAIKAPTWMIEGAKGNASSLRELCEAPKSDQVRCVLMPGQDHFTVLQPVTRRIAAQIAMGEEPKLESPPIAQ